MTDPDPDEEPEPVYGQGYYNHAIEPRGLLGWPGPNDH